MPSVLSIQGARKSYGPTKALCGVDFELAQGQWLGLLGPNGAGKTTLIRSIAGRVRLDDGMITLFDTELTARGDATADVRKRLGIVPQEIAIFPLLTARENLRAFGSLNGVRGEDLKQRIDWALEWIGLADRAGEPTKRFSGGMKRRLNIACAVLHRPDVLLLDEPTAGVDPQSRQRIWEMLEELRRGGSSILLTTHALDEAQQVCETIVIIDHGTVIASGTLHELLQQTVGAQRRVIVHLDNGDARTHSDHGFEPAEDGTIKREISDVAGELRELLDHLNRAGATVRDLRIEAPSLQAVFLHLTGRELRE